MLHPDLARVPRHGGVTVWLVLALGIIIGIVALGMDGGRMMDERRHVQAAADAAALAAAANLYNNYPLNLGSDPSGAARQAAVNAAAANGYANDSTHSTVTVNIPPQAGAYQGQAGYVEVVIQSNLQAGFSAIFNGSANLKVTARAVALGHPKTIGVLILQTSGANVLSLSGNSGLSVIGGSVTVNSTDPGAVAVSGNATISAQSLSVAGTVSALGLSLGVSVSASAGVTADPLLSLPAPNLADYTVQATSATSVGGSAAVTLQPGVYDGGLSISGNAAVTLQPGVYIMNGGGFQVSGNASVTGSGVMIYNTGTATNLLGDLLGTGPSNVAGAINISGNASINLTPPTSGPYSGIGFFQDRSLTTAVQISGNAQVQIPGIVYAAGAAVSLSGNATLPGNILGGGYISATLSISGNATITVDPLNNFVKVPDIHLVE
jgi:hypothetical protein